MEIIDLNEEQVEDIETRLSSFDENYAFLNNYMYGLTEAVIIAVYAADQYSFSLLRLRWAVQFLSAMPFLCLASYPAEEFITAADCADPPIFCSYSLFEEVETASGCADPPISGAFTWSEEGQALFWALKPPIFKGISFAVVVVFEKHTPQNRYLSLILVVLDVFSWLNPPQIKHPLQLLVGRGLQSRLNPPQREHPAWLLVGWPPPGK